MVGLGKAIGEGASAVDRADMLTQLGERKLFYIEAGKKKAEEQAAKQKDAAFSKEDNLLISEFKLANVDEAMVPALQEAATDASNKFNDIYENTHTAEDFYKEAAPVLLNYDAQQQKLKQAGENYKLWRNLTPDQVALLPFDQRKVYEAIQNGTDYRDISKEIEGYQTKGLDLFPSGYNTNTGEIGKPTSALGRQNQVDLIGQFVKNSNDAWADELGKQINVSGTTYQEVINTLPITKTDALEYAKKMGLPAGTQMPSMESKAEAFMKTDEGRLAEQSWLRSQFLDGEIDQNGNVVGQYKDNSEKYFKSNPVVGQGQPALIPNKEAIDADFKKYLMDVIGQGEKTSGKFISGRPLSASSYGGYGFEENEGDKIYANVQRASQTNLTAANNNLSDAQKQLSDYSKGKKVRSSDPEYKKLKDAVETAQQAVDTREKENKLFEQIYLGWKSGKITYDAYKQAYDDYVNGKDISQYVQGDNEMVTVTVDGQTGQIPKSQVEAFKKKYPNAQIQQ